MLEQFMIILALKLPVPYRAGISVHRVTGHRPATAKAVA